MKKSTMLYRSCAILGTVLLALVIVGGYLTGADCLSILASFSLWYFGGFFVLGGIVLLTIGTVGIGRQYFKTHKKLFTLLGILLVPPLIFGTFIVGYAFAFISAPMFPLRSEITQVTVVDNSPLVLFVGVKAITSRDSIIEQASVINDNGTLVAQTSLGDREMFNTKIYKGLALAVLPAGSEITVILNFSATLPSGDYTASLSSWHVAHGSSPFAIP